VSRTVAFAEVKLEEVVREDRHADHQRLAGL
jgi:hypothetical protein